MSNEFKALRKSLRKTMKERNDPILGERVSIVIANLRELERRPGDADLRALMTRNIAELEAKRQAIAEGVK